MKRIEAEELFRSFGAQKFLPDITILNPRFLLVFIKLNIQALEKLPILLTDFSQSLLNRDFPETGLRFSGAVAALGLFLERDGRFKDEHDVVARGADFLHRLVNLFRLIDCVVDGFPQLADQFFQVFIQDFTSQLQILQFLVL